MFVNLQQNRKKMTLQRSTLYFLALAASVVLYSPSAQSKQDYAPFNFFGSLWPNARVYYKIDNDYPAATKAIILKAMLDIASKTCVQFVEARGDDPNHLFIRKSKAGEGCMSGVGYDARPRQLVEFEPSCFTANGRILKVLLHVLGLPVENNRPDRDQFVKINFNNVNDASKYNTRPATDPIQKLLLSLPFDYDSVTNNDPYSFAINPKLPTISARQQLPRNVVFGQRTHLSATDVQKLKLLYCNKNSPANNVTLAVPPQKCGNCHDDCSAINPCCEGFYCFQAVTGQICFQNDEEFCEQGTLASAAAIATKRKCKTCNERCSTDNDCCKRAGMKCKDRGALMGKVCYGTAGDQCVASVDCCPGHCLHYFSEGKPSVCSDPNSEKH